jgi:peptidoglycan hydrolase-like protein with peptidoglycan-binding domain
MQKLLAYKPEPFPELDTETGQNGFYSMTGAGDTHREGDDALEYMTDEWPGEYPEDEFGRRRRPRVSAAGRRKTIRIPASRRSAMPRIKPPLSRAILPRRPFPTIAPPIVPIAFVPPWGRRSGFEPVQPWETPRPDDRYRADQAGPEGSGTPSASPPTEEPTSEYVRWVQECLNRTLGLNLPLDGVMGMKTRSAVRMFQERRGLAITGLVGPKTQAALNAACRDPSHAGESTYPAEISVPLFHTGLGEEAFVDFENPEYEEDLFLGKAIRKATHAVSHAARSVGKAAGGAARTAYKTARKGYQTASRYSRPPGLGAAIKFAGDVARGKNVGRAFRAAAKAGIADVRDRMRYAQVAASFVPGVGTGVAAALGAANALAAGRPITEAVIEAARAAVPGGPLAQAAFDVGVNLARGRSLSQASLAAARNRMPPGARAAFDTAVALAKGQSLQKAAWAGASHVLPKSPFAADALAFARRAASGRNLQLAALSPTGQRVYRQVRREIGELECEDQPEFEIPSADEMRIVEHELLLFNNQLAAGRDEELRNWFYGCTPCAKGWKICRKPIVPDDGSCKWIREHIYRCRC